MSFYNLRVWKGSRRQLVPVQRGTGLQVRRPWRIISDLRMHIRSIYRKDWPIQLLKRKELLRRLRDGSCSEVMGPRKG